MTPKVSVLINNCNYGRYLAQAIDSVLAQDFDLGAVEIIVVDDGSTDESREILSKYSGKVTALFQENQGQAGALNTGFKAARGEYVCLLDSDDWWRKDKLKKVIGRFDADPALAMVQHWTQEVDPAGRELAGDLPDLPPRYVEKDFLETGCWFTGTTGLSFRRALADKVLPIPADLRICADGHLFHVIFYAPVGNIAEPLGFRRVHDANRFAGRFHDARLLERHLEALAIMRRELDKRLAERKAVLSDGVRRAMALEELTERLFLLRYQGRLGGALACWRELKSNLPPERRFFKAASLLLALASPSLYLALQRAYLPR